MVFGDYPVADPRVYEGPSLFSPQYAADTSLYKYLATGDYRMHRRVRLSGTSRSSFYDGHAWSTTDLSAESGRQYGRYRIFLILTYANGYMIL